MSTLMLGLGHTAGATRAAEEVFMVSVHPPVTYLGTFFLTLMLTLAGCGQQGGSEGATADQALSPTATAAPEADVLTDEQLLNLVRVSYPFVAMYNVNNKMVMDRNNPLGTGGWNRIKANTRLTDHTMQAIARPNNDTLYVTAALDLTNEPVILEAPPFDSTYVSLMVTGYDHYVNIPMSTRQGHFSEPSRILFYTERTPGYAGEPVEGVDIISEMTGDYVSAVYRVMPHANEPERMERNAAAMQAIKVIPLSAYRNGTAAEPASRVAFPAVGSDFDVFENNFLEVMQFVANHTTFQADDEVDQKFLAAVEPLGVVPGRKFDPTRVTALDGTRLREIAQRFAEQQRARAVDPEFMQQAATAMFLPKGLMSSELLTFQSVIGPIGQPAEEAVYPSIATADGEPMNAMYDYVIRMAPDEMPPATAFWSATLYDTANGFFMPNGRKKYSVGENGGMKLDEDGGIAIYIAAEQPEGIPGENWLPLVRGDYMIDVIMRIYAPDLARFAEWGLPVAERL
jgi:hypothetical protein